MGLNRKNIPWTHLERRRILAPFLMRQPSHFASQKVLFAPATLLAIVNSTSRHKTIMVLAQLGIEVCNRQRWLTMQHWSAGPLLLTLMSSLLASPCRICWQRCSKCSGFESVEEPPFVIPNLRTL
jgi:hypothetical protein